MHDLRLVGVHEDGQHLLLADAEGGRFRLPLDDALRAAARRDRPRLGQLQIELEGGMRPREVQALIRAGLSSEEVAERAGWTVEKVARYEGPVLAERDYVAELGRGVRLRTSGRPAEQTLAQRVGERLADRGVDATAAAWDASRDTEGQWTVLLRFPAGGRQRTAAWSFDVAARTLSPRDDEARWLTADDAEPTGPIPTRHPTPAAEVYDLESDGGVGGEPSRPRLEVTTHEGVGSPASARGDGAGEHRSRSGEPVDLMAALRESSSRGRRRRRGGHQQPTLAAVEDPPVSPAAAPRTPASPIGSDSPEPLSPKALSPEPPLPEPPLPGTDRPGVAGDPSGAGGSAGMGSARQGSAGQGSADSAGPVDDGPVADAASTDATGHAGHASHADDKAHEGHPVHADDSGHADDIDPPAATSPSALAEEPADGIPEHAAATPEGADAAEASGEPAEAAERTPEPAAAGGSRRARRRAGRPSVPRWDDVMFGTKGSSPSDE